MTLDDLTTLIGFQIGNFEDLANSHHNSASRLTYMCKPQTDAASRRSTMGLPGVLLFATSYFFK